ncbi:hypothetical protein RJT34_33032 [Clitoria ternatea]|uniref:Uncharacterized protein n=1 Tax=Clitoria ternatea TaxID=43366 RepID=A0AAN9EX31_CLITE
MHKREASYPQRRRTPSFSSTLLDTIYRSFDQSKSNLDDDPQLGPHNHTTHTCEKDGKQRMNLRRAVMIEDWMEKQSSQGSQFLNSSSSSSECSSGGIFSSSETDTTTHMKKQRPRPEKKKHDRRNSEKPKPKPKQHEGGGFARTKLRALKIYGELKHPISPGSRIASFLSSIFNSENVKKAKMCYVGAAEDVSFEHKSKSPCFSSTSRRSCMSKAPSSSKGKSNNGVKRSVRFYPVSVILGEDSEQESGHKGVYESEKTESSVRKITRSSSIKELKKNNVVAKENGVEAVARGFVKRYRSSGKGEFDVRGFYDDGEDEDEDEDEEDDDVSCSSSDLFELDHLIGAARYQEELPVYETTNLETNKAIANGLHL